MDTLELLTTRRSTKSLTAPAPDELQLETMLQAASQVPDHGNLTPWRFIVINSEAGKTACTKPCSKRWTSLISAKTPAPKPTKSSTSRR